MLNVVSAIITRSCKDSQRRVLLTQRDPGRSDYGWKWECPGGKVEREETDYEALRREVQEELGARVIATPTLVDTVCLPNLPKPVLVTFYRVLIGAQMPVAEVAIGLGWFTAAEVRGLVMSPANVEMRERLCAMLEEAV